MLIKQASKGGSTRGLCRATYNINGKIYTTTTNNGVVSTSIGKYLIDNVSFIKRIDDYESRYGNGFRWHGGNSGAVKYETDYICFDGNKIEGGQDFLLFIGLYPILGNKGHWWTRSFRCLDGSTIIDNDTNFRGGWFIFYRNGSQTVNIGPAPRNELPKKQDRSCADAGRR